MSLSPNVTKSTRGKTLIVEAFLSLLEEKGFYETKVVDIIDRAGVSRGTFYFHFEDKYALANEIEQEMLDSFLRVMVQIRNLGISVIREFEQMEESPYTRYFDCILQNKRVWKIFLSGKGPSDFSQKFTASVSEHIKVTYKKTNVNNPDPDFAPDVIAHIGAYTLVGIITDWVTSNMSSKPEEMGKILSIFWKRICSW